MLEPVNSGEILISLFFIDDRNMRLYYPISHDADRVKRLYDYVFIHRLQLLGSIEPGRVDYSFRRLCFPFEQMLLSLKREAELGRQLYDVLGEQMPRFRARRARVASR